MAKNPDPRSDDDAAIVTKKKERTKKPRLYRVLLHNDDYTTMEFVVWVLREVFHMDETQATQVMLTVHHKGVGTCGVFAREIAETKVARVTELARQQSMPLLCSMEPE